MLKASAMTERRPLVGRSSNHILLNAQLLSTDKSYRSAGVSQYSQSVLKQLGQLSSGSSPQAYRFSAFTSAQDFHTAGIEIYVDDMLPFRQGVQTPLERILWEQVRLPQHALDLQADMIHGLVNVLPLRSKIPGIVTIHDLSFLRLPNLFPWTKQKYLTYLCGQSAHNAEQIIAVSQQTADDLMHFFDIPAQKIHVVYNGVAEQFHPVSLNEQEAFREQKGLPPRFILYLGTLEPRKNLELLVQSFAQWKTSCPHESEDVKLVVAGGKGWFFDEIFAAVKELSLEEDVLFPGYIPAKELPGWYSAAELFVYPSRFEGFGLPVLEAMACGVPVLCSDTGSLVELVQDTAFTVPANDVDGLTAGLCELMANPGLCEDLRQRGLARSSLFSWEHTVQQTVTVYDLVQQEVSSVTASDLVAFETNGAASSSMLPIDKGNIDIDGGLSVVKQVTPQHKNVNKSSTPAPPSKSRFAHTIEQIEPKWWPSLLVLSDVVLTFITCIIAYWVRYNLQWFRAVDPAFEISFTTFLPVALTLICILPIAFWFSNVYPYKRSKSLFEEIYAIGTATTASVVIVISISLIFSPQLNSRLIFLYIVVLNMIILGLSRFTIAQTLIHLRKYQIGVERVLIVGLGQVGRMVMRTIVALPKLGYLLVGFLDDDPKAGNTDIGNFKALGSSMNLEKALKIHDVQRVIICLPWQSHRTTQRLLRICENAQVSAQVVPDLFQFTKSQMVVEELNGIPLISTRSLSIQGWNLFVKRATDLGMTLVIGTLLLPLLALIAFAIRLDSAGPIFYSQIRIGKNGKPFRCYKFRSMIPGADEMVSSMSEQNEASGPLFKIRHDPRRTRVGRFIRRFSLDELPQLYNVLLGQMSLVGPRPNLPQEVAEYQEWHIKRLSVSPGITGLWQVSGRSDLTFDEMVLLDIYYVENWHFSMEISILLRSLPAIIRGRGAY
ncbi:MAG: exopolysaccharide biosynthesis polyprenyl glycosylphosphotransferase [Chloroflexota bacterium]